MLVPEAAAASYVDAEKGVADAAAALEGARWILIDTFAEDAELVGGLRQLLWDRGEWTSTVVAGKEEEGAKFSDYFSASEAVKRLPVAPRAGAAARPPRRHSPARRSCCRRPTGAAGPTEPERRIAGRARHRRSAAPGRSPGSPRPSAGRGRSSCCRSSSPRSSSGCARRPRPKRSACSAATCTICCSPRRPASGRRWGSIPGFEPA